MIIYDTEVILRVDGAKEFVGSKMKDFCHLHHITLQIVTSYSHTMQERVEGAIGIIKQHSRIALSTSNAPTRLILFTNAIICGARLTEMDTCQLEGEKRSDNQPRGGAQRK